MERWRLPVEFGLRPGETGERDTSESKRARSACEIACARSTDATSETAGWDGDVYEFALWFEWNDLDIGWTWFDCSDEAVIVVMKR